MRLFIGVDVGQAVRDEVGRVSQLIGDAIAAVKNPPRVTWVASEAVHLNLRFIGEVDEERAQQLARAFSDPIDQTPFDVEWRGLGAFPSPKRPRVLWIGVASGAPALGALEAEVSRRVDRSMGLEPEPFRPHVTLGRVRTPGAGVNWLKLLQSIDVRGVRSRIDRVTLYHSALSPKGPHYTEIAHAALDPARSGQAMGVEGDR